jgi:hypothetical protein
MSSEERVRSQYSRDEVEEILRRAAERTHDGGEGLTHDELVSAAREAGIDTGAVEEAAGELAESRQDRLAVKAWEASRRRRFASHLVTWAVVNAGLFMIDLLSGGGWWFFWPLLGWGIAVALQGAGALRAPTPEQVQRVTRRDRRRRESERKREARRAQREARRNRDRTEREHREGVQREFERAVETGVTALMSAVARRIESATRLPQGPLADTEFNRYVTEKKTGPRSAVVVTPAPRTEGAGPRVRVGDAESDAGEGLADRDEEERPSPPRRARR